MSAAAQMFAITVLLTTKVWTPAAWKFWSIEKAVCKPWLSLRGPQSAPGGDRQRRATG